MTRTASARRAGWLLGVLLLAAVAAPLLAPYAPNRQLDLATLANQPPSLAHPFGTDPYSRDVLSRVLYGARVSLGFATVSVTVGLLAGLTYGGLATMAPARWRTLLRRGLDVLLSIPRILMLLAVSSLAGQLSIAGLAITVGLTGWFGTGRQIADEFDALRTREFALAARATGVRPLRVLLRHLLPHVVPLLVINGTFAMANTIGLEAGLSFLGLGIQPPEASWGTILRDGVGVIDSAWWLTVFPGVATLLALFSCNLAGDALRDRFAAHHVAGL